ncbi:glycoside hydrolase family 16 protein [Favolaschia claudopus]|uniref:Glycoside hydrolase family 16 protein n=1 Tax=Favolaschia claudopus TaxID=2862362 RepID=A0AAW0BDZ3_9AGAR
MSLRLLTLASTVTTALCATYSVTENIVGAGFYDAFNFEAIGDPTEGRVNYVDKATAMSQNLTFASGNKFVLRADSTTVIDDSSPTGRNSVRIRTNNAYTTHVAVFDIAHMPQGCGSVLADMASCVLPPLISNLPKLTNADYSRWETDEANWAAGGEVDILEGVNDQGADQVTLHTVTGCTMPATRDQTGTSLQLDCDHNVNGNAGCGVRVPEATSYGPSFNANGGGWYAVERTDTFINIWFWPRNAGNVPADVKSGAASVNTDSWGTPTANFPNTSCNFPQFFDANNIIINLTFCGQWAGNPDVYAASGCPSTCNNYVNANPSAFVNAYFEFNSLNVYH